MACTQRLLDVGPVSVEVTAAAGADVSDGGWFVAWSDSDLLTVSLGRYSLSLTEEWMLLVREYESARRD